MRTEVADGEVNLTFYFFVPVAPESYPDVCKPDRIYRGDTFQEASALARQICGDGGSCTSGATLSARIGSNCPGTLPTAWAWRFTQGNEPLDGVVTTQWAFYTFGNDCPDGYVDAGENGCLPNEPEPQPELDKGPAQCDINPSSGSNNPIRFGTGTKFKAQTDYQGVGPMALAIRRTYNSQDLRWRFNYSTRIERETGTDAVLHSDDGSITSFARGTAGIWETYADRRYRLIENADGSWVLKDKGDLTRLFDAQGRLTSITNRAGQFVNLAYEGENLSTVTHFTGRVLSYTHSDQGRIASISDPAGNVYRYNYDTARDVLTEIAFPDSTPTDLTDNPTRIYHYEIPDIPGLLTGITDELGNRYATYTYDTSESTFRATSSELAGGVSRDSVAYNSDGTVTVTNALGKDAIYSFTGLNGIRRVETIDGQPTTLCNAMTSAISYDQRGFIESKTDNNGNIDLFSYDDRGLLESHTESTGSDSERVTSTTWHPEFRVPTQIERPGQTESFTYDLSGRRLTRTLTDTQSQTSPYATAGNTRTWTYTYNAFGLVATVDGPRTDVSDVTTYGYDSDGDLETVTNALGHVTRVVSRDARGFTTQIEDPNNIVTKLVFDERGRLQSRTLAYGTTSAATTVYDYDRASQLTKVTQATGAELNYAYDSAHRLTRVTNKLGHYVDYGLDAAGNRIEEQHRTGADIVRRTQTRVFDELSRLRAYVGGMGQTTNFHYDDNDNRISVVDPLNREGQTQHDALDRLIASIDPDGFSTAYNYDERDNLTRVTDQRGLVTNNIYSGLNDLLQTSSPDTGTTIYRLDAAGNRTQKISGRNIVTNYRYDALNRVTQVEFPETPGLNID